MGEFTTAVRQECDLSAAVVPDADVRELFDVIGERAFPVEIPSIILVIPS
jgi:hypothetical protein